MRLRASVRLPGALALGAAVVLSGCAVAHAPGAPDKPTRSTGVPLTSAKSPARPAPAPERRAVAEADAILASFAVPKGARKLAAAPSVDKGVLKSSFEEPATPDLVDKAEWWIAPGAPQSVLAWEARHLSHRFLPDGIGTSYGRGSATTWDETFLLPAVPAVFDSRDLLVQVVQDGAKTAIRVDAQVSWQPARPASEKVPAAAKAVTISADSGLNQGGNKSPKPVTITDRARVRALTALINGLGLFPPGDFSCPSGFGDDLVLTFRAGPRALALAVATVDFGGCDSVDFTIGGKPQPTLAGPGTDIGPRILKLAGLSWKSLSPEVRPG
jgi:hypothetical protein